MTPRKPRPFMSAKRFEEAIELLNLNQTQAGKFLGINGRTSRRYIAGDLLIPKSVAMLLELMVLKKVKPDGVLELIGEDAQ